METEQKTLQYWWCAEFRSGLVALSDYEMLLSRRFPCLKDAFVDARESLQKNPVSIYDGTSFILWFENSNGIKISKDDAEQYLRVMELNSTPNSQGHRKRSLEDADIEYPGWAKTKQQKTDCMDSS
ncbi:uncharacterized protein LOC121375281 [Gigantopelta aegis]|uniref:uncharacterized protein LOC121375281 n=1 Tax=Gigantopelta aegis TaxID=1735272 RepID=UPI001B888B3B|nr:uncharacterized protein LOC121375281 [Gigantopelta aegis]